MNTITRRQALLAGLGLASTSALAACGAKQPAPASTTPATWAIPTQTPLATPAGATTVTHTLTPRPVTLDLGGVLAKTWAYTDELDGNVLRGKAGDLFRVTVDNQLPTATSVHWHGIALRNASDGVPGVTQDPIAAKSAFTYEFVAPHAGTYFFHPHSGVQIDRGLYAPLVLDDPRDPGDHDAEWVLVLDDWTDGVGKSPDAIFADFKANSGPLSQGMNHDMGGMHHGSSPLGDAGDVSYPHYVVNGRIPAAPRTLTARPGDKVRLRLINAGADTIFKVGLSGHRLTITHADGFAVQPVEATAIYLAMGERIDATVTVGDGVFVLQAAPEGKTGTPARAIVKTGAGSIPPATTRIPELGGKAALGTALRAADAAKLPDKEPEQTLEVQLNGQMKPYAWGINGKKFGEDTPLSISPGQRVRMRMTNMTMMAHPMHIHGHTWSLPGSNGLRKDTVLLLPMQTIEADLQADNPGAWMLHCHNIYHAELGMMTTLRY